MQRDNSTFRQKVLIRRETLKYVTDPVIMETHGGAGKLYDTCYRGIERGVVFEKDPRKASLLGLQRPTWAVYEADCENAIGVGAGAHLKINLLDLDPYGDPWPVIEAFFKSERPRSQQLVVVVNDGLRQKVKMTGGWDVHTLQPFVTRFGNNLYSIYLDVCQELMKEKAALAGYHLGHFAGYYCGHIKQTTHYLAVLEQG